MTPDNEAELASEDDWYEVCNIHMKIYHPDKGCLQCDEGWNELNAAINTMEAEGGRTD